MCLILIHVDVLLLPHSLDNTPQTAYPLPMAMQYGQQQGPPVISSGPALWPPAPRVPQASIGTDKVCFIC